jgi:hypothetical protein
MIGDMHVTFAAGCNVNAYFLTLKGKRLQK